MRNRTLGDLKSYGSRALNQAVGKPAGGTWWTGSGSKRPLLNEAVGVLAAIRYVEQQHSPLGDVVASENLNHRRNFANLSRSSRRHPTPAVRAWDLLRKRDDSNTRCGLLHKRQCRIK